MGKNRRVSKGAFMEQPPLWRHHLAHHEGVATVAFSGELDLAAAQAVQGLLFEQIEAPTVSDVRVDLADVGFLDSTTLGVLISALHHAEGQGRGFVVINPSPMANRILSLTGLDRVLLAP
jgi:anti-anti-sigma factor